MADAGLTKKESALIQAARHREEEDRSLREERKTARTLLEVNQPVVFRLLDQTIRTQDVSHAYLFTGKRGSLKREMAVLLAQSVILGAKNGLIREEERNEEDQADCRRIAEGTYGDLLVFDGYQKQSIDKKDVDMIQSVFAKTSMEKHNRKVYIIDRCENMTIGAMNSLLKFLEEPAENVYAILIADNPERLLPTIISRCIPIRFYPIPEEVYRELALQEGIDAEDAFFLSRILAQTSGYARRAASVSYQRAKLMFKQWAGIEGNRDLFLVDYDVRYRLKPKDLRSDENVKDSNLDLLEMFFGMVIGYCEDILKDAHDGPSWYHSAVKKHIKRDYQRILEIAVEERDRCNRVNDLSLLLNQAIYRLEV